MSATSTALVDLGDIDGLVVDDDLTAAVREAVYAPTEIEYAAAQSPWRRRCAPRRSPPRAAPISRPSTAAGRSAPRGWPRCSPRSRRDPSAQLVPPVGRARRAEGRRDLVEPAGEPMPSAPRRSPRCPRPPRRGALPAISERPEQYHRAAPARAARPVRGRMAQRRRRVGRRRRPTPSPPPQATLDAVQIIESSDQLVLSDISSLRLHVSNALPVAGHRLRGGAPAAAAPARRGPVGRGPDRAGFDRRTASVPVAVDHQRRGDRPRRAARRTGTGDRRRRGSSR